MKNMNKLLALALVIVSVFSITIPAMAGELSVANKGTAKYLYNIENRTTAPTFSIRTIDTPVGNTGNVQLNYNDLNVSATYFKKSNVIGVNGGMTEKTLKQKDFSFVAGRTTRAQLVLTSTNGAVAIRFSMN